VIETKIGKVKIGLRKDEPAKSIGLILCLGIMLGYFMTMGGLLE